MYALSRMSVAMLGITLAVAAGAAVLVWTEGAAWRRRREEWEDAEYEKRRTAERLEADARLDALAEQVVRAMRTLAAEITASVRAEAERTAERVAARKAEEIAQVAWEQGASFRDPVERQRQVDEAAGAPARPVVRATSGINAKIAAAEAERRQRDADIAARREADVAAEVDCALRAAGVAPDSEDGRKIAADVRRLLQEAVVDDAAIDAAIADPDPAAFNALVAPIAPCRTAQGSVVVGPTTAMLAFPTAVPKAVESEAVEPSSDPAAS